MEFERDQAQLRGEGTGGARIDDVEDLAAVGAVLGTSVASETLPKVGCRATKAVRQADPGDLGIGSGAEDDVLQERRAVDRWRAWR